MYKLNSENQLVNILTNLSLNKNRLEKLKKNINLKNILFDTKYNLNQYYLNFKKAIN